MVNIDIFQIRSQTFFVLGVDTGTRLDEEVHTGGSRALDGPHEGCASTEGPGIYFGPGLHQKFNNLHLASVSRVVEGRPEELVTHIYIRPVRNSNITVRLKTNQGIGLVAY